MRVVRSKPWWNARANNHNVIISYFSFYNTMTGKYKILKTAIIQIDQKCPGNIENVLVFYITCNII